MSFTPKRCFTIYLNVINEIKLKTLHNINKSFKKFLNKSKNERIHFFECVTDIMAIKSKTNKFPFQESTSRIYNNMHHEFLQFV